MKPSPRRTEKHTEGESADHGSYESFAAEKLALRAGVGAYHAELLWRVVYAAICVFMLWLVVPLFLEVIVFSVPGNLMALMRLCVACIAVLYVFFGPPPPQVF